MEYMTDLQDQRTRCISDERTTSSSNRSALEVTSVRPRPQVDLDCGESDPTGVAVPRLWWL
jgi:hypothetical protein